jgi:hypothetical protein
MLEADTSRTPTAQKTDTGDGLGFRVYGLGFRTQKRATRRDASIRQV